MFHGHKKRDVKDQEEGKFIDSDRNFNPTVT